MTKEIRFSTHNLGPVSTDGDCFLDPSDPIYQFKAQGFLGTLDPATLTAAYDSHKRRKIADQHFQLRDEAKQQGIRPGTPAWFALSQTKTK